MVDLICVHCQERFRGVEAAHYLSTHLMQNHKGICKPEPIPYRQISSPIPLERKANPMHLRDVAMNQIGEWTGVDLDAHYYGHTDPHINKVHSCVFLIKGKRYLLEVKELN